MTFTEGKVQSEQPGEGGGTGSFLPILSSQCLGYMKQAADGPLLSLVSDCPF